MLTQSEIFAQADLYMLAMRLDEFHRMAYMEGATWANKKNIDEIAALKFEKHQAVNNERDLMRIRNEECARSKKETCLLKEENNKLLSALQLLYDEQNGAPLETRRAEWQKAMDAAQIALEKYDRTT